MDRRGNDLSSSIDLCNLVVTRGISHCRDLRSSRMRIGRTGDARHHADRFRCSQRDRKKLLKHGWRSRSPFRNRDRATRRGDCSISGILAAASPTGKRAARSVSINRANRGAFGSPASRKLLSATLDTAASIIYGHNYGSMPNCSSTAWPCAAFAASAARIKGQSS